MLYILIEYMVMVCVRIDVNIWFFYNDFILLEIYNDFFVCIKFFFIKIFRCIYILIEYYV